MREPTRPLKSIRDREIWADGALAGMEEILAKMNAPLNLTPTPSSSCQSVLSAGWPRQEETAPGEAAQMRVGPAVSEPEEKGNILDYCARCRYYRFRHPDIGHDFVETDEPNP